MPANQGRRVDPIHVFIIAWAALEIFLFGGQVYGWPSLVYILKAEGYYQDLCVIVNNDTHSYADFTTETSSTVAPTLPPGSPTGAPPPLPPARLGGGGGPAIVSKVINGTTVKMNCKEQDFVFQQIFTIATVFTGATLVLNGILFDKAGTLICRLICMVGCIGSYLMLAFSHPDVAVILYPTITVMEATGFFVMLSNLGLGGLLPNVSSTILAFYHGCFDASACILVLLKVAYHSGVSLKSAYVCMALLFSLMVIPSTFLFLPRFKIPTPAPLHYRTRTLRILSRLCGERGKIPPGEEEDDDVFADGDEEIAMKKTVPATDRRENGLDASMQSVASNREPGVKSNPELHNIGDQDLTAATSIQSLPDAPVMRVKSEVIPANRVTSASSLHGSRRSLNRHGSRPLTRQGSSQTSMRGSKPGLQRRRSSLYHFVDQGEVDRMQRDLLALEEAHEEEEPDHHEAKEVEVVKSGKKPPVVPFKDILRSPLFISDLIWISLQRCRNWIFLGLFNVWITGLANNEDAVVSHYTAAFQTMQFFGILFAPLSGHLMDRRKKNETNEKIGKIEACFLSFLLDSIVGLLLSIGACIPVIEVQYVTCFLHVVHRAFLYGPNSAFMAKVFPLEHFGKLFGTYMTVSALFSLIQFPLFILVKGPLDNDPFYLNLVLIAVMVLAFGHPLYVFWYCKKLRREDQNKLDENGKLSPKKIVDKSSNATETKPLVAQNNVPKDESVNEEKSVNANKIKSEDGEC
ncbi:equilibrative nucleobase transporter 1-like [Tubulanus polymorphus]|uniref:equilibrative nucleobase transporter 1-like n=1 Tax=Tubulanus polymorphus TaxID=672921 RepID=UPI003DA2F748